MKQLTMNRQDLNLSAKSCANSALPSAEGLPGHRGQSGKGVKQGHEARDGNARSDAQIR